MKNYDKYLNRARVTGIKTHFKSALTIGGFFFAMFSYYAYAFYTGSYLVTEHVINSRTHEIYNGGDIIACFFGIVFGVFSLGAATPNIKAITEGTVAGKMAYDIIDRKPKILLDEPN
jgi:ATP-binding cassette, subfamily B (MDR/TAP), member 1